MPAPAAPNALGLPPARSPPGPKSAASVLAGCWVGAAAALGSEGLVGAAKGARTWSMRAAFCMMAAKGLGGCC